MAAHLHSFQTAARRQLLQVHVLDVLDDDIDAGLLGVGCIFRGTAQQHTHTAYAPRSVVNATK